MHVRFFAVFVVIALVLSACATEPETPGASPASGLSVTKDSYDGATLVRQVAVTAGVPGEGDFNALGFEWRSKFANRVVLVAGTRGVVRVSNLVIDVDDEPVTVKTVSEVTDHGAPGTERWSMRRFEISWVDLERMAAGKTVRFKVVGPNEVFGTAFGRAQAGAPVNRTLAAFRAAVKRQRGEPVD